MNRATIGSVIRQARQNRGWTLRDVEERTGVSFQYISAVETGAPNANITLSTLEKVAVALGLTVEVRGVSQDAANELEAAAADLTREDLLRLARIARSLPHLRERTREVLTASFEGAAEDAR